MREINFSSMCLIFVISRGLPGHSLLNCQNKVFKFLPFIFTIYFQNILSLAFGFLCAPWCCVSMSSAFHPTPVRSDFRRPSLFLEGKFF